MKNHKISQLFSGLIFLFLFFSCNHAGRKPSGENDLKSGKYRVALELILEDEALKDSLLDQIGGMALDYYQWKNHIVLFGEAEDTLGMNSMIRQSGINLEIKRYDTPMYVFDREKHCGDSTVAKPWTDYLLTANLVADSAMQQEYMHYHEVQFKEWPDVAQGFCNADFQQLLVFRNGRQLLLVISIPADKTLDELNPKTEENNPRVVEWNKMMSKYQEGIEGASPGETWVFLSQAEAK